MAARDAPDEELCLLILNPDLSRFSLGCFCPLTLTGSLLSRDKSVESECVWGGVFGDTHIHKPSVTVGWTSIASV